jgi:hypothetical protein
MFFLLQTAPPEPQIVKLEAAQLDALTARMDAMQHDLILVVCFCILLLGAMALMMALGRG